MFLVLNKSLFFACYKIYFPILFDFMSEINSILYSKTVGVSQLVKFYTVLQKKKFLTEPSLKKKQPIIICQKRHQEFDFRLRKKLGVILKIIFMEDKFNMGDWASEVLTVHHTTT